MLELSDYLKFFVSLFALVNPIGILPVFISMTNFQSSELRNKTSFMANTSVAVILLVALLTGEMILNFFSISLNSFKIAGGILIVIIAMSMISGKIGEHKQNQQEKSESGMRENIGVVPLALPLMTGPGAMSSTIVWSSRHPDWISQIGFSITIIIFAFCCWALFKSAPIWVRMLGQTGINVVTRIMGLLLMSLGIEFIISGIGAFLSTFPVATS